MFDSIDEYMSIHRVSVLRVILRSHHLIILACLALTAAESLFTTSSITSEGTAQLSRCHCAVCSPKSPPALSRSAASSSARPGPQALRAGPCPRPPCRRRTTRVPVRPRPRPPARAPSFEPPPAALGAALVCRVMQSADRCRGHRTGIVHRLRHRAPRRRAPIVLMAALITAESVGKQVPPTAPLTTP